MLLGLSTNLRCDSSVACLASSGRSFVFRYHSRTTTQPQKRLHPAEAAALARGGLFVATVYQDRARKLEDFGAARGTADAQSAIVFAGQVGQPAGSAVYFAVDTDFSAAEIQQAVIPYFRAIDQVFREAGGGTAYLKIGVYGSGLACRLVGALGFVSYRWLAEATGWRESKTYTSWTVKQTLNTGQSLCNLGTEFERCDAQDEFGQFQPVGFNVQAGEGEVRQVVADGGNLRHCPTTRFNEPVTFLPGGQSVRLLGPSAPGWQRVRTTLGGSDVIGHIAESRLEAPASGPLATPLLAPTKVAAAVSIPAASLAENKPSAHRGSTEGRAFPIGEASRKTRDPAASPADRVRQLTEIGDWLASPTSPRYQPTLQATYCNVYAADYCYLAGVYLPRVWWTDSALVKIAQGMDVPVLYGKTVRELKADDLFAWLCDMGPLFGWTRVFDTTALQDSANGGGIGVICADRKAAGRSGHITVVVPEVAGHAALRDADGHVVQPLQSQAGARNFRYGSAGPSWWLSDQFIDRWFFIHA
ncbi:DUF1906 domain-containing protein [Ideonella sp. 4Y16]|uniref:DUF1906 domain-containing protein n=1 Tax=Ideonella alba TaxID=2824118 RepID=UPI001B3698B4|nr:DUF1906 domain-containing protein [Ideonella alba]MBQ0942231.1 DUF1906 domain-containing protein [Ideonella alba]